MVHAACRDYDRITSPTCPPATLPHATPSPILVLSGTQPTTNTRTDSAMLTLYTHDTNAHYRRPAHAHAAHTHMRPPHLQPTLYALPLSQTLLASPCLILCSFSRLSLCPTPSLLIIESLLAYYANRSYPLHLALARRIVGIIKNYYKIYHIILSHNYTQRIMVIVRACAHMSKKIESVLLFAIPLTPVLKANAGVAPGLGKG
jgi:hypothetical protein